MGRIQKGSFIASALCMIMLILDSKGALSAASDGLELCIRTAIPSLFPFFVLSGILVPGISGRKLPALGKILKVPPGWESIFLLGCIGGYPVGAQCIAQAYRSGQLSKSQAQRMLGFCTNCGPSFLFGVVAPLFPHPGYAGVVTLIGIISAMIVGFLWPVQEQFLTQTPNIPPVSLPKAVRQAIQSMASVCAWIILGKIILHYMDQWILHLLQQPIDVILTGMLELTNGCIELSNISDLTKRFVAASVIVPFGGLCVAMQVSSICAEAGLSSKNYLPQKLLQAAIAALIAFAVCIQSFPLLAAICAGMWILCKSAVAFRKNMMYNEVRKGGFHHAVPKKD